MHWLGGGQMKAKRYLVLFIAGFFYFLNLSSIEAASINYHYGDHGSKIAQVQNCLISQGLYFGRVDGYFSYTLVQAVKTFQKQHGLIQDGRLNEKTYEAIMKQKPKLRYESVKSKPAAQAVLHTAKSLVGTPYRYGGTGPKNFDCSGYVEYVFSRHGTQLPRTADRQFLAGQSVFFLQPADLVFFSTDEKGPSHCGIYIGNGQFIHASSSRGVMISRLDEKYWHSRYLGARRVL